MAKWGEGDPRWIVEERPDATNVNNWHWSEKNATQWSKDKLKSLLVGLQVDHDQYSFEITELTSCEGEASANNRKKKLIFFYEWVLKGEWKGSLPESDEFKGKFEVTNLSEENGVDDLEVIITMEDASAEARKLKEHMHKKGSKVIITQLETYIEELKNQFSEGLILPGTTTGQDASTKPPSAAPNTIKKQMNDVVETSNCTKFNRPLKTKKISMTVELMCEAEDLYRVLTDRQMVAAFTRCEVAMDAEVGGKFSLFSGNVEGSYTLLEQGKKIVMQWRATDWPKEHYSTVTMTMTQKDCATDIALVQTSVPEPQYDKTLEGWHRYYWEPIRQTFGYGSRLY